MSSSRSSANRAAARNALLVTVLLALLVGVVPSGIADSKPKVLVVTDVNKLAKRNDMSAAEVRTMMKTIGVPLELKGGDAVKQVQSKLKAAKNGEFAAVQILGGDGVVPYGEVRNKNFDSGETLYDPTILTDDLYGDTNGDTFPEVGVARLPDCMPDENGRTDTSLQRQFDAAEPGPVSDTGQAFTTSDKWEYAKEPMKLITAKMPGMPDPFNSPPVESPKKKADLDPDVGLSCFLLHGDCSDTSKWWGDDAGWGVFRSQPVAIQIDQADTGGVVLTGACWGGWLDEHKYAKKQTREWIVWPVWRDDAPVYLDRSKPKDAVRASNSMSLAFLRSGARCFIGSTSVDNTGYSTDAKGKRNWNWYYTEFATSFYENSPADDPFAAFVAGKKALQEEAKGGDVTSDKLAHSFTYYGLVPVEQWATPPKTQADGATSIVFDVSTSMRDEPSGGQSKLDAAKDAGQSVVDILDLYLGADNVVGVATFSEGSESVLELTQDSGKIESAIGSLYSHGNTDMLAGIRVGIAQLEGSDAQDKAILYLSDGMDTANNTEGDILAAAEDAADAGIRIYTIGFGDSGTLNEPLLQEIADATGGEYKLADPTVAMALVKQFTETQVTRSGQQILLSATGTVNEGETEEIGVADVGTAGDLSVVLAWPGSDMDIVLTDPAGAEVASGYPGVELVKTERTAQLTVSGAKKGEWKVGVLGVSTSMPDEPYYALASLKETSETPVPSAGGGATASDGSMLLLLLAGVAGVGGIAVLALTRTRSASSGLGDAGQARESADTGAALVDESGRRYPLRAGANTVGRGSSNDVALGDPGVSRRHATLHVGDDGVRVIDRDSTGGTFIGERRVTESYVTAGAEITFGTVTMRLDVRDA